ncbi:MAG: hypothetical protein J6V01_02195, partial [Clostridia bacterium]|nr:hypothetical protein [Clostridia bacterium]
MKLAGIRLLDIPPSADREYTYAVPPFAGDEVRPGRFVSVPFGRGDSTRLALVTSVSEDGSADGLKSLAALCSDRVSFDRHRLELLDFICSQTLCTYGDAIRAMIPSAALSRLRAFYLPASDGEPDDSEDARVLLAIRESGRAGAGTLSRRFGKAASTSLKRL